MRMTRGYASDKVVSSRKLSLTHGKFSNGDLMVTCWCETRIVRVTPDVVLAGGTESCGHRQCVPDFEPVRL